MNCNSPFQVALSVFFLVIHIGFAQNASVHGKISTSDGSPAGFVNLWVKGANKGVTADENGNYRIEKLSAGEYTLQASFVSLKTVSQSISLEAQEDKEVNFTLDVDANKLEEVLVRANPSQYVADYPSITLRLNSPLLEVPQNIQVITGQIIKEQQIFDMLEGVTRNVSGVSRAEHWDNYAQINMRGSRIAAFRNGMNIQMPFGPLVEDMSMVERIEFVKGPAGFMLANGEPSGFYNVVSKKPTGISKGEATMTVGSFNTYRSTLDLDGVLSKDGKLLYRLNVMGQMKGSHRDFEYNNRASVVPVLKYKFNDQTSLTAEYTYQYSQMSMIGSNYVFSKRGYGDQPVNFTTAEPNMPSTNINDHSLFLTLFHELNEKWQFNAQVAFMRYSQTGQSLWPSGIIEGDTLVREMAIWDNLGINRLGQFFVNGSEKWGITTHNVLAGLDMGQKQYWADWNATFPFGKLSLANPVYGSVSGNDYPVFDRTLGIRQRGLAYNQYYTGIYVQDEIGFLNDRLKLTLAGRYTTTSQIDPYSGKAEAKHFTPRLGISWKVSKGTNVYGVFDEAFVPQAGTDFQGNSFDPITGNNKELGIKREWKNGLWTSSLGVYRITKNNVLTADPSHVNFSVQLGQTQTQGIEFDLRGQIAQGLNLTLNYAHTDAKVTKDTQESNVGVAVPGSTKHIGNAWLSYHFLGDAMKGLGLSLGGQYQNGRSSWYAFDGRSQAMEDYFRMDGAISYQKDNFALALNINNVLNKYLYVGGAYYSWGEFYYWQSEALRNARLTASIKF